MRRWGPPTLWALFTVVAVVSGLVAVALIGRSVSSASGPVLSAAQVRESLAAGPDASPTGSAPTAMSTKDSATSKVTSTPTDSEKPAGKHSDEPGKSTSSSPSAGPTTSTKPTKNPGTTSNPPPVVVRTLSSRGGSVVAECRSGSVFLRSWSPANGYRVEEVSRGPGAEAEIKFQNATSEIKLQVRCQSGVPTAEQEVSGDGSDGDDESGADESGDN